MQYITQLLSRQHYIARTALPSKSQIVKEQSIVLLRRRNTSQARMRTWLLLPRIKIAGGANRDRTDDLLLAKQALSQLSYGPASRWLVGLDGFEPSTPALSRRCSNQLSYRPAWVAILVTVLVSYSR